MKARAFKNLFSFFTKIYILAPSYAIVLTLLRGVSIVIPIIRILLIKSLVNEITFITNNEKESNYLWKLIIVVLVIEFVKELVTVYFQEMTKRCVLYLNKTQYPKLIKKISKLEFLCFEDKSKMDLIARVKKSYISKLISTFTTTLYFTETILSALAIIILICTEVGAWGVCILLASMPLIIVGQKSGDIIYQGEVEIEKQQRYLDYIEELYTSREAANERLIFRMHHKLDSLWKKSFVAADEVNLSMKKKVYVNMCRSNIVSFLGYAAAVGLLCFFFIKGLITYGLFISIIISILRLMYTLSYTLAGDIAEFSRIRAFVEDYNMFLILPEVRENNENIKAIDNFIFEKLEFKDVVFKYPNADEPILNNLSFKLEKGKRYAFVGENGAGKTTITKLLLGLYEPNKGQIKINDKLINEYDKDFLKELFSVVFQDFSKYEIKVRDAIELGNRKASEETISNVLEFVGLDFLYNKYDDFLEKELGKLSEDSIELSGGQWQRLAIARALVSNRSIFVLDEVTSAIDPIQESEIYGLFERTSENRTCMFITHRLGSTKFVDHIYVIENGCVSEQGNHTELIGQNGTYTHMYNEQSRWYV